MIGGRKAVRRDVVGMNAAQLIRARIHHIAEALYAPAHMLRDGDSRVIAAPIGADGGERIIRTVGSPACIAKNRFGLPGEIPLSWTAFINAYQKTLEEKHGKVQ